MIIFSGIVPDPPAAYLAAGGLLRRAIDGDRGALSALLEPYRGRVFRMACRISNNADDAEDLAQDALVRIIECLPTYRGECAFDTWVYRVVLNVCLTARRRRRAVPFGDREPAVADPSPGTEETALGRIRTERITDEIRRLPALYCEAVLLRLAAGLAYNEIAEILGISLKTALIRVHRGKRILRDRLGPWLDKEEDR